MPRGRPKGAKNNPTEKLLTDALRVAVSDTDKVTKKRKIRAIAEKITAEALAGQHWACQMIGDRLEGKPAQQVNMDGDVSGELVMRWADDGNSNSV